MVRVDKDRLEGRKQKRKRKTAWANTEITKAVRKNDQGAKKKGQKKPKVLR